MEKFFHDVGSRDHGDDLMVLNSYHSVHYVTRNVRVILNVSVHTK